MFQYIVSCLQFSWKKATVYKANLASWVLADLGMYLSTIFVYLLLGGTVFLFAGYNNSQMLLYISNSFLINNIYSILFSEAIDTISIDIRNGKMYYSLLKPVPLTVFYIAKNLNLKSLVITPFLIVFNVYCLYLNHLSLHIMNFLLLLVAVYSMGVIFLLIICLDFIGLRSEAINPIMVELLELRDRPDKIFNTFIRSIFIYIIPIYLTSAIPTKIMIENCNLIEIIYFFLFPVIGTVLSTVCIKKSIKYYTFGTEEV